MWHKDTFGFLTGLPSLWPVKIKAIPMGPCACLNVSTQLSAMKAM